MNSETPGKIDFAALGQQQCELEFGGLDQTCSQDPSSQGYNEDYPALGAVAGDLCGEWSIFGQPPSRG